MAAFIVMGFVGVTPPMLGQVARGPAEFQLTKIARNLVSTPQFSYTGAQQYPTNQRDRWLEVEVEFSAAPAFTDELTFKYFILLNGKLLTGEVTHTNIAAGRENRSVMYLSPRTLARFMGNRAITPNAVETVILSFLSRVNSLPRRAHA